MLSQNDILATLKNKLQMKKKTEKIIFQNLRETEPVSE